MTPDEEFAQFVFYHFGGYWTNRWPSGDPLGVKLAKLPERILERVKQLAAEHKEKMKEAGTKTVRYALNPVDYW